MKARINGVEVEGTPEEVQRLVDLLWPLREVPYTPQPTIPWGPQPIWPWPILITTANDHTTATVPDFQYRNTN